MPILVLGFVLVALVYVLLRFVELFFAGVSRGHERVAWLAPDLVSPTSALVRIGIVLLALVFAGPIVSGDPDSVFARLGSSVLLGIALALTPLLASIALGTVFIFTRRLRIGRQVELGGYAGGCVSVGPARRAPARRRGGEVRVPHLRTLISPTRLQAPSRA